MSFSQKNPFNADANFTSINFGVNKPVLEVELNEMQSIMYHKSKNSIKTLFGDGVIGKGAYNYSSGTFTLTNEVVLLDGDILNIDSISTPVLEGEAIYLHSWTEEVTYESEIKKYGNKNSTTTVPNHIKDARLNMETSRRTQLLYNLSTTLDNTKSSLKLGTIKNGAFELSSRVINSQNDAKMFDLPFEGTNISLENTEEGFVSDLEILGNTYQDSTNLSIIKSSGELLEDGRYKLSFKCCGKNLNSSKIELGALAGSTGMPTTSMYEFRSIDFIQVEGNVEHISSMISDGLQVTTIFEYDKDYKFIKHSSKFALLSPNCKYVKLKGNHKISDTQITQSMLDTAKLQLEVGKIATQYEDYQEYVQDIYLPCEIAKVGNVADRLYYDKEEKAWCVEVSNDTILLNERTFSSNDATIVKGDYVLLPITYSNLGYADSLIEDGRCITTFEEALTSSHWTTPSKEGIYIGKTAFGIVIHKDTINGTTKDAIKNYFVGKGHYFKRNLDKSQRIILPDAQQVKFKTFMNHTNIMYLGEIPPVIKGKVPKSLNATVYNNVQAIERIDRDLEKVKRLEQATNTVITTEKDFVSIENTNVGFVKSVELEGNTLVNLYPGKTTDITIPKGQVRDITIQPAQIGIYTLLIKSDAIKGQVGVGFLDTDWQGMVNVESDIHVYKIECKKDGLTKFRINSFSANATQDLNIASICLLKGDHTKNPPKEHFEGLKSVGDDVEDIEVSTINENLFNDEVVYGFINAETGAEDDLVNKWCKTKEFIKIEPNTSYYFGSKATSTKFNCVLFYDINKNLIGRAFTESLNSHVIAITPVNAQYARLRFRATDDIKAIVSDVKEVMIVKSKIISDYIPYKKDTQKVLYKDKDGNYKKPILRMATETRKDTIELHDDGKLYCHKRCGEFVYKGNPNENWTLYNANDTHICVRIPKEPNMASGMSEKALVCNLFPIKTIYDNALKEEGCYIDTQASAVFVRIAKSKADTVENFKKYLQANNMVLVFTLVEEEVYNCLDLNPQSFEGTTNYQIDCGALIPKSRITLSQNIGNVVSDLVKDTRELQEKVSEVLDVVAYDYESENNYVTMKNSKKGVLDNVRMEGNTLVNLSDSSVTGLGGGATNNKNVITLPRNGSVAFLCTDRQGLQGKTLTVKYHAPLEIGNSQIKACIRYKDEEGVVQTITAYDFVNGIRFTVPNVEYKAINIHLNNAKDDIITQEYKITCVEGDHTQNPPPYFEGIKSVGELEELEITSCNENILDITNLLPYDSSSSTSYEGNDVTINGKWYQYTICKVEPNTDYYINSERLNKTGTSSVSGKIHIYKSTKEKLDTESLIKDFGTNGNGVFNTGNTNHIGIVLYSSDGTSGSCTFRNTYLIKDTQPKAYVPHKSDKKKAIFKDTDGTWKPVILREWDYIEELENGKCKYHRGSGQDILDGSDDEIWSFNINAPTGYVRGSTVISNKFEGLTNLLCDTLGNVGNAYYDTDTSESISGSVANNKIYIRLNNNRLSSQTSTGFKEWLQANPVTVVYQLAQEEVYECVDLSLSSYEGETNVFTNSSIPHKLKITQKQGLKARFEALEQEVKSLDGKVPNVSKDLVNTDVINFTVGTGTVNGSKTDHTKEMEQSLVTLNNIEGKTVKQGNILKSVTLGSIVNGGQNTPLEIDWSNPEVVHNNATFTSTGNSVKITCKDKTWSAVQYNFNVEPNTEYAFMCDWETTSETAYVLIKDGEGKETYYRYEAPRGESSGNGLSTIFRTGKSTSVQLTLYSSVFYVGGYTEYKNLKVIPRPKGIVDTNITLRSLPNGVCDTLENGNVYTNIVATVLNGREADWVHWKTANNIAVYYTRPSGIKNFADDDSNTGIICDKFPSLAYNETIEPTKEGVSLYSGYGYIGVCIASSKASNLDNFKAWLKTNPITVYAEYYDDWKTVTPVNPTIIANRGDVIHIDSSLPLTCTHKVYLNTKAQVEEVQKVVDRNVKSIFDIKKWIDNFKVSIYTNGDNGFIKLPKVLGGLTIQWGTVADVPNNTITKVNYPIAFSSTVKFVGASIQGEWYAEGGVANSSNGVVCNRRDLTFFNIGHNFGTARSLNWIAIGF